MGIGFFFGGTGGGRSGVFFEGYGGEFGVGGEVFALRFMSASGRVKERVSFFSGKSKGYGREEREREWWNLEEDFVLEVGGGGEGV